MVCVLGKRDRRWTRRKEKEGEEAEEEEEEEEGGRTAAKPSPEPEDRQALRLDSPQACRDKASSVPRPPHSSRFGRSKSDQKERKKKAPQVHGDDLKSAEVRR